MAIILMPAQSTVTVGAGRGRVPGFRGDGRAFDVTSATIKTLCGESDLATAEKGKLTLAGYQDWTEADGLCNFLWENALMAGDFVIVGTDEAGATATMTGQVQCRRPSFGPQADDAAKFSSTSP